MSIRFEWPVLGMLMSLIAVSPAVSEPLILEEITVRGQKVAPMEEILTIREVRESAVRDIGEALELVPGLTSKRKGAIATDVLYPYLLMDAEYDTTERINWMTSVDLAGPVLTGLEFQAWWNELDHLMNDNYRVSSMPSMMVTEEFSMQTDAETELYGFRLGFDLDVGPGTLEVGADYYLRNWDAVNQLAMYNMCQPQPMLPDVDIENVGFYSIYSWALSPVVRVSTGARFDLTDAEAGALDAERWDTLYSAYYGDALNDDTDFSEVSGNLQLTWPLSESLELFSGVASSVRTPDPQEIYIGLQRPAGKPNWVAGPFSAGSTICLINFTRPTCPIRGTLSALESRSLRPGPSAM